ncbi:hypothetical protein RUM44_001029 [Polyplax serrata]|uniref:N-acetyltransferase domain-containing protein n=1 Tax=Polyplax serrata TaxID=468196 RepID=A0ABR1BA34_POLSC
MGECVSGHQLESDGSTYHVEPLHNKPYLINACVELINLEWKRSFEARKRSIAGSSENFPMSLLLLTDSNNTKVVGHCKISKLPLSETKVFVETVVIHPKLRGKGLGKFLMSEVEALAKRKNIRWIYLSTKGQEEFYRKLGYVECPPITLYGSKDMDEGSSQPERIRLTSTVQSNNSIDDGTGVISCVHSEMQFEDAISTIEREHEDVLNHSLKLNQSSLDQSSLTDVSMEDSIFNEKSIQNDEQGIIKRNLLQHRTLGPLELSEEIVKVSNKLRDGYNPLRTGFQIEKEHQQKRRCSGLMTFDNVHHLSAKYPQTRTIDLPKDNSSSVLQQVLPEVVPPHVESTITFDTFNC